MGLRLSNTCIYRHIRLDTNQVFYIGIGSIKRAYRKTGRNNYWNNITNKTVAKQYIVNSYLNSETIFPIRFDKTSLQMDVIFENALTCLAG